MSWTQTLVQACPRLSFAIILSPISAAGLIMSRQYYFFSETWLTDNTDPFLDKPSLSLFIPNLSLQMLPMLRSLQKRERGRVADTLAWLWLKRILIAGEEKEGRKGWLEIKKIIYHFKNS